MAKRKILDKQRLLDELAIEVEQCEICKEGKAGKAVFGEGNPDADIVFLGEAPGKKEAEEGRPFVGPAGKILRTLIKEAGLKEEDVYITSPVKYLPEYVTPRISDIEHGREHLFQQLKIIEPKIIVLMGNTATFAMLNQKYPIAKNHGKIINEDNLLYLLTYHPAAPLYDPKVNQDIKEDFIKLKALLQKRG